MADFKRPTEAEICAIFDERYRELAAERDLHKIKGLFSDELGFLLIEVNEFLPYAPLLGSIMTIDFAVASKLDETPVIVYAFHYDPNSIGENAFLFLVRTKERKIRLFTVETHCGRFYLCEYRGFGHINYGVVDLEELVEKLAQELFENKPNENDFKMGGVM